MKETIGRAPVFLMDDIFGELDVYRSNKISLYLKQIGQAFITMTDFSKVEEINIGKDDKVINVNKGEAVYAW
jgi:DNA replication and repair protein RecF